MDKYHLTKKENEWKLTREGADRAALKADTKEEALRQSVEFMNQHGGSMKVHTEDGQFQEERTYPGSADPYPPKG
ncbi:MAG TPA: DUF2188 domain-containing protein [Verrucomicrobiae bacterium]|mgnify:CR=1 FL=1|nr:DUF2188 domain-containing protein [Verrucomicrobiae bacterium]